MLGAVFAVQSLVIIAVAVAAVVALQFFLGGTRTGRCMQATAQNPTLARLLGIPVERMILYTFLINAALVALASLLVTPIYLAKFTNGESLGLYAFIAAIVGGFNQVRGAIVGGLLLGVIDNFAAAYLSSQYRMAIPLLSSSSSSCSGRKACSAGSRSAPYEAGRKLFAGDRARPRRRLPACRAVRPQALRHLHPQPVGGDDDRRHRPQSDARLCRADFARAGGLRRHRRLRHGAV